jgi:hypothetical protein
LLHRQRQCGGHHGVRAKLAGGGRQFHHSVVARVGHEEVAGGPDRDGIGLIEAVER